MIMHVVAIWPWTLHPYYAGTEHARFSPDQAKHQVCCAMRCLAHNMKGELHPTHCDSRMT